MAKKKNKRRLTRKEIRLLLVALYRMDTMRLDYLGVNIVEVIIRYERHRNFTRAVLDQIAKQGYTI